jgi:hypothetical protein
MNCKIYYTQCIDKRPAREPLDVRCKQFIIYLECEYNLDPAALLVFCGSCGKVKATPGWRVFH